MKALSKKRNVMKKLFPISKKGLSDFVFLSFLALLVFTLMVCKGGEERNAVHVSVEGDRGHNLKTVGDEWTEGSGGLILDYSQISPHNTTTHSQCGARDEVYCGFPCPGCSSSLVQGKGRLSEFEVFLKGRKGKFLDTFERIFASSSDLCVRGNRFIDIGAGTGEISRWVQLRCNVSIIGFDIQPEVNKYALLKREQPLGKWHFSPRNYNVYGFNGSYIPLPNASADVIIANMALHHAAKNVPALLNEASRLSVKYFLLFEDVDLPWDAEVQDRHKRHDQNGVFRTDGEWSRLLHASGFAIAYIVPVGSRALSESKPKSSDARLDWKYQKCFVCEKRVFSHVLADPEH